MWVYRIQRIDGAWLRGDAEGRPLRAVGDPPRPVWTRDKAEAAWWTKGGKNGGPQQWTAWYSALGEPDGECKVQEENDPSKSIGGEHD